MRQFYVYILASDSRVLYVGVTNDLVRRLSEHRQSAMGFAAKYRVKRLVYFESTLNVAAAIGLEKKLKGWSRTKKIRFIESSNPAWHDLSVDW